MIVEVNCCPFSTAMYVYYETCYGIWCYEYLEQSSKVDI